MLLVAATVFRNSSARAQIKKVGRAVLLAIGLEFVVLQALASMNLITVHWHNIGRKTEPHLSTEGRRRDQNRCAPFRCARSRAFLCLSLSLTLILHPIIGRLIGLLTHNLPFKIPFVGALYAGFRVA